MKIVLDTNIVVSAFLNPYGNPARIMGMVFTGLLVPCLDARILSEYKEVLSRPKFQISSQAIEYFLDFLRSDGHMSAAWPLVHYLPDRQDEVFLEVAVASKAYCLITGNLKHFPKDRLSGIPTFLPAQFLEHYRTLSS